MAETAPLATRAPGGPGRFRRVLGAASAGLGLTLVFTLSLASAVLLHLDLAPTRRAARKFVNEALFPQIFRGKLVVGAIDRLSLRGVTIREVHAYDPRGNQVVHATGIRGDADVVAIVRSVLGSGDLRIGVKLAHLDHADVALERGPDGELTIAELFLPRQPAVPPPPGGRKVRFVIERVEIDHVWAHGAVAAPSLVDGEIAHVVGHVEVTPAGIKIDVDPVQVDGRAPVPRPLSGTATFKLRGGGHGELGGTPTPAQPLGPVRAPASR